MLITTRLRLTSPFLGSLKLDNKGVRRFETQRGEVVVRIPFWQFQFQIAANELHYDVDAKTIEPPLHFRPATIHLYERIYSRVNVEWFESFKSGTVLTLDFLVKHQEKRAPDPVKLLAIMRFTGDRLGLSQWGSKFGFGRFEVLSLTPADNSVYEQPI